MKRKKMVSKTLSCKLHLVRTVIRRSLSQTACTRSISIPAKSMFWVSATASAYRNVALAHRQSLPDSETIQISSQDNQETEVLPNAPGQGGPKKQKPRHASVDSAGTVKSKTGKPVKGRPAKTVDAFSQLMKQSKQSVGVKKKKK